MCLFCACGYWLANQANVMISNRKLLAAIGLRSPSHSRSQLVRSADQSVRCIAELIYAILIDKLVTHLRTR